MRLLRPVPAPRQWLKDDDIAMNITEVPVRPKNKPGRGRVREVLYSDRVILLGPILKRIGLTRAEVFQTDAEAEDIRKCSRSWRERMPPPSFGQEENPERAVQRFLSPPKPKLKFALSHGAGYIFEHLEKNPIYGVEEMQGVIVDFKNGKYFSCEIGEGEPYPSISTHGLFFYSRGFGLAPLFPVETPYDEYIVHEQVATKVTRFMVGKLEPHSLAPMPVEFRKWTEKIREKPGLVLPYELSFLRASKQFYRRLKLLYGIEIPSTLLCAKPIALLEAYIRAKQLICGTRDAVLSFGSEVGEDDLEVLQSFMIEYQKAPWHSTMYYKWLAMDVASVINPFEIGTRMSIGDGLFPCYSPLLNDSSDPVVGGLTSFSHMSLKKKKSKLYNKEKQKIWGTKNDIRALKINQLKAICALLGCTSTEIGTLARWDMAHLIIKVASSHIGPKVLSGKLLRYVRDEEKTAHHNTTKAKEEDLTVQRLIESQEYYIQFRRDASIAYQNLRYHLTGSDKRQKIEEVNDRCDTFQDFDRLCRKRDVERAIEGWRKERAKDPRTMSAMISYGIDGFASVGAYREIVEEEEEEEEIVLYEQEYDYGEEAS